jgi:N-acetylglutamate synthase-like GNAT family acetyltransferase
MFVSASHRGREFGVAGRLLEGLLRHASNSGLSAIYLGTTDKFIAAHRFYEKNGFTEVSKSALPADFPLMPVDTKFYCLRLLQGE